MDPGIVLVPLVTKILSTVAEAVLASGVMGGLLALVRKIQQLLGVKDKRGDVAAQQPSV